MAFNKHSQENKKDLASVNEIEERWNSKKKYYKNYLRVGVNGTIHQKTVNPVINNHYHLLVNKLKEMYSKLPKKEDRVMIELNLKSCPLDSSGLYCIMTPSLYFYLECDVVNNYRIEYVFHNCPFEAEIQKLIDKLSIRSFMTEVMKEKDYPAFFERCLRVQPERFINLL